MLNKQFPYKRILQSTKLQCFLVSYMYLVYQDTDKWSLSVCKILISSPVTEFSLEPDLRLFIYIKILVDLMPL